MSAPSDIEQLLGLPSSIADLSDEVLESHLARFFPATRPSKPLGVLSKRAAAMDHSAPAVAGSMQDKIRKHFITLGIDPVTKQPIASPKSNLNKLAAKARSQALP